MISHNLHNKILSLLVFALISCAPLLAFSQNEPQVIDKVVALVGENIVLLSDIESQIDQMTLSDIPVNENTRCEVLEDQMYQKLFLVRAKADSLIVSEDQIEQELNRRLRYFISQVGSEEELVQFYGKSLDEIKEDFRDEVQEILTIQQMQQKVTGDIKVSPAEVREFYASIPKDKRNEALPNRERPTNRQNVAALLRGTLHRLDRKMPGPSPRARSIRCSCAVRS